MVFSGISFLYYFLPVTLILYFIIPNKYRNVALLAVSLLFYFYGEQYYTLILLFSALTDYTCARLIEKYRGNPAAKLFLILSITVNIGLLMFFKYFDFFSGSANNAFGLSLPLLKIALPIGISFFTFQTMSYTIDVYRGEVPAQKNFTTLFTYVSLFPQLIAGPIVRYKTVEKELSERTHSIPMFGSGAQRFITGLAKKVLLANQLGALIEVFRATDQKSVLFYWIYALALSLQIYFDFSGYSDMAIGLGRMLGFNFPENFNYPYISKSIAEFWRRWHISLGSWFRDYVYIPLGGSRVKLPVWLRNVLLVWLLTGLWHGADWPFIAWGLFIAAFLIAERLFISSLLEKLPSVVSRFYFFFVILLSMVIFNGDGIKGSYNDVISLFGADSLPLYNSESLYHLSGNAVLLIVAAFGATPLAKKALVLLREQRGFAGALTFAEPVICSVLLITSTAYIIDGSFNPFLYFRF